jgi:hypothetical protein
MYVLCKQVPDDALGFRVFAGFHADGAPRYTQVAVTSFTALQMSFIGMLFFTPEFAATEADRYNKLIASENKGVSPELFVMQLHILQAHVKAWSSQSKLIIDNKSTLKSE